jgi:hypothetical protein
MPVNLATLYNNGPALLTLLRRLCSARKRVPQLNCRVASFSPQYRASLHIDGSSPERKRDLRVAAREAVGISVSSAGFKTLPVWLENSFLLIVRSCC